jgi:hypothetical protein
MRTVSRILAVVLALALVVAGIIVALEVVVAALDRGPLVVPYDEWSRSARRDPWSDPWVRWLCAGIAALGLLLLALAVLRRRPRTLPVRERGEDLELEVGRRSLRNALAQAAGAVDGVEYATARLSGTKAKVRVRTRRRVPGDLPSKVREAVSARVATLDLAREPELTVGMRQRQRR